MPLATARPGNAVFPGRARVSGVAGVGDGQMAWPEDCRLQGCDMAGSVRGKIVVD
ncbi:hypothetical protein JCM15519_19410 [Fundidesulfovibrio butyratiphilus]